MPQLLRNPLAAAALRLSPQPPLWSPLDSSDWLEPRKSDWGCQACPPLRPFPIPCPYTLLFDKSQRTEKFLRSYSLSSAERLFTSGAARCDCSLIPVQNSRLSHHHSFPLHSICIVLQSENGARGWPLRCLVLTADATRRMISQSFHGVWPRVTGN